MIAYSYPGSNEFLVGTVGEVSPKTPKYPVLYNFVMTPFDKSNSETIWFKFSSISSSRVFDSPSNFNKKASESTSRSEYQQSFDSIKNSIKSKQLEKVVLSRRLVTPRSKEDLYGLYISLKNKYPEAFTYLVSTPETGTWLGASPELVLSENKGKVKTTAIAGTQPLNSSIEDIRWGAKEIQEHAYIESYLTEVLTANNIKFNISDKTTIPAGGVCHIYSMIDIIGNTDLIQLSNLIHPGPALSGYPVKESINLISQLEETSRQFYCGMIGPINSSRIDWFANIRCLQVHPDAYTLYVGGGITADSDFESEWEETNLKASTLLSILETATVYDN